MAAEITVFKNFTPNSNRGIFYMPRNSAINHYEANKNLLNAFKEEAVNNFSTSYTFKVYKEYIDLNQSNVDLCISYIAVDNGKQILFYFVESVLLMPQGIRCFTRLDNWATYISVANISNVHFTRSNLLLRNEYDLYLTEEENNYDCTDRYYYSALPGGNTPIEQLRVYAVVKFQSDKSISQSLEEVGLFCFDPLDVAKAEGRNNVTKQDILNTIEIVFRIYSTQLSDVPITGEGDAQILKVYLMLNQTITGLIYEFNTINLNNNKFKIEGLKIENSVMEYTIPLLKTPHFYNPAIENNNEFVEIDTITKPLYFGTKYDYIKLPQFVLAYRVKIKWFFNRDNITAIITSGNESRDITKAFEIPGDSNTGTLTSGQEISKWLGVAAQVAGGIFQIKSGGAGIVTGALSIANTMNNLLNQNGGTVIGGGNGVLTFIDILDNGSGQFLYFLRGSNFIPPYVEAETVLSKGALCDIIPPDINKNLIDYISTLPLLYTMTRTDLKPIAMPFIACEAAVDNIPYNAAQEIADNLKEGVRIKFINEAN